MTEYDFIDPDRPEQRDEPTGEKSGTETDKGRGEDSSMVQTVRKFINNL